ncbi:MAG: hypothetical protein LBH43_15430 [Treponema sp.]|jgi:hypothetical protein|nr:hypothetical protein [Treponema sp.]
MRLGIYVRKSINKSFIGESVIKKARAIKYVKREGYPGHYKYWYRLPDGRIGSKADLDAAEKGKRTMRLGIRKPVNEQNPKISSKNKSENSPEKQLEDIRKKYEGTSYWLKAPNGKDTNLNEKQWLQVRTPNFKKWFGDWENDPDEASKVLDENGEPLIVYHGTHAQFDEFDSSKGELNDAGWLGAGHYFYGDEYESSGYAGRDGYMMKLFLNVREPYYLGDDEHNELVDRDDREYSTEFSKNLKNDGYDGVYYNGDLRQEWMVFNSNQIKSASSNLGIFDSTKGNINKGL